MSPLLCLALLLSGPAPKGHAAPAYHVLNRVPVGGEGGWDYLTVAGERLYISRGTHVIVFNTELNQVVGDIPNTPGVHGIAIVPRLGKGFTSNGGDNTVTVFDTATLHERGRVSVGTGPDAILYDPYSRRVFTFNGRGGDATAIDAATEKVVGTVALEGRPEFAATDGAGKVYVNIEDKSEVAEIDPKALKVTKRWSLSPGDSPSGLAIDPKHHRLFSVCRNGMMVVSDTDAGKVIATPAIGQGPDAAAFDPKEDLAFSSNGEGTLTIVKGDTPDKFTVVDNVKTEQGARTMALDPRSHRIFLVTARMLPPPPGQTPQPGQRFRRSYEPGSFVVLVVGP